MSKSRRKRSGQGWKWGQRRQTPSNTASRKTRIFEQLEERHMLTVEVITGADALVQAREQALEMAFDYAANLANYSAQQLEDATRWVVRSNGSIHAGNFFSQTGLPLQSVAGAIGNTYYAAAGTKSSGQIIAQLQNTPGVTHFYPDVPLNAERTSFTNDPYTADYQWWIKNTGQLVTQPDQGNAYSSWGYDVNVEEAWKITDGSGAVVAIVDDGIMFTHPDLAANYDPSLSFDFADLDYNPSPAQDLSGLFGDFHGTAVAGVAVGNANNGIGGVGVAPGATLAGIRMDFASLFKARFTDEATYNALTLNNDQIDVYNNSWGSSTGVRSIVPIGPFETQALFDAAYLSKGGLGSTLVFSAGNSASPGVWDNANHGSRTNSPYVITVSGFDEHGGIISYAEGGPSVFVAAPTSEAPSGIFTTDLVGDLGYNKEGTPLTQEFPRDYFEDTDYTSYFGGTSSAAPAATGVIALIYAAARQNGIELTSRDVKHILARSSRTISPTDSRWENNYIPLFVDPMTQGGFAIGSVGGQRTISASGSAIPSTFSPITGDRVSDVNMQYARATNSAGFTVHDGFDYGYGHGAVDAKLAVELASQWESVGTWNDIDLTRVRVNLAGPSGNIPGMETVSANGNVIARIPGGLGGRSGFGQFWKVWLDPPDNLPDTPPRNTRGDNLHFFGPSNMSLESVQVTVNFDSLPVGASDNMRISLISPDGTHSELTNWVGPTENIGQLNLPGAGDTLQFTFGTERHWGERSEGFGNIASIALDDPSGSIALVDPDTGEVFLLDVGFLSSFQILATVDTETGDAVDADGNVVATVDLETGEVISLVDPPLDEEGEPLFFPIGNLEDLVTIIDPLTGELVIVNQFLLRLNSETTGIQDPSLEGLVAAVDPDTGEIIAGVDPVTQEIVAVTTAGRRELVPIFDSGTGELIEIIDAQTEATVAVADPTRGPLVGMVDPEVGVVVALVDPATKEIFTAVDPSSGKIDATTGQLDYQITDLSPAHGSGIWQLAIENWSGEAAHLNQVTIDFYGTDLNSPTDPFNYSFGRIQGKIGQDINQDGEYNFSGIQATKNVITPLRTGIVFPPSDITQEAIINSSLDSNYEPAAAGVNVYVDINHNGQYDVGELHFITGAEGNFYFDLPEGEYDIRYDLPDGMVALDAYGRETTSPVFQTVSLGSGAMERVDFALRPEEIIFAGQVFADIDADSIHDSGENTLSGFRVFVDVNENGRLDFNDNNFNRRFDAGIDTPLEPMATTASDGSYEITVSTDANFFTDRFGLQHYFNTNFTGDSYYTVMVDSRAGWMPSGETTAPGFAGRNSPGLAFHRIFADAGETMTSLNFGMAVDTETAPAFIAGTVFDDLNDNGLLDAGEPGVLGATVYLDLNQNGELDNEPSLITGANGSYLFDNLEEGSYDVRIIPAPGYNDITKPFLDFYDNLQVVAGSTSGIHTVAHFGIVSPHTGPVEVVYDYGDLPGPYATTAADGGPRHGYVEGFYLGSGVDIDADGEPDSDAATDALDDGVVLLDSIVAGHTVSIEVDASSHVLFLQGWIDFNADGDFDDEGEHLAFLDAEGKPLPYQRQPRLDKGVNSLQFVVPDAVAASTLAARFRYSEGGAALFNQPNRPALFGEVEDYMWPAAVSTAEFAPLVGDFDGNRVVNQVDFLLWKESYGSTDDMRADGNGDGRIDAADYTVWRNNRGAQATPIVTFAESESASLVYPLAEGEFASLVYPFAEATLESFAMNETSSDTTLLESSTGGVYTPVAVDEAFVATMEEEEEQEWFDTLQEEEVSDEAIVVALEEDYLAS